MLAQKRQVGYELAFCCTWPNSPTLGVAGRLMVRPVMVWPPPSEAAGKYIVVIITDRREAHSIVPCCGGAGVDVGAEEIVESPSVFHALESVQAGDDGKRIHCAVSPQFRAEMLSAVRLTGALME